MKEKGVEFNVKYSDEGHKLDWERWGNPGHAQRFQIMEPLKKVSKIWIYEKSGNGSECHVIENIVLEN